MHEIELGVWKALFKHLLRIIEAHDKNLVNKIDRRYAVLTAFLAGLTNVVQSYRQVPTFGRDTIRCFTNNVSEMKQLAARDYEDLLQVCASS